MCTYVCTYMVVCSYPWGEGEARRQLRSCSLGSFDLVCWRQAAHWNLSSGLDWLARKPIDLQHWDYKCSTISSFLHGYCAFMLVWQALYHLHCLSNPFNFLLIILSYKCPVGLERVLRKGSKGVWCQQSCQSFLSLAIVLFIIICYSTAKSHW